MPNSRYRIGFLGAGLIAAFHAHSLRSSDAEFDELVVFDPSEVRRDGFAARFSATSLATETAVLDQADALYVCTWTSEHERLVNAACERGLPVFCEKPLAPNVAGAQAMVAAVQRAGVTNQVGLVLRSTTGFALVRAVHYAAAEYFAFAGATGPVFAAVGQTNALGNACCQNGLVGVDAEAAATGLYGNGKRHGTGFLKQNAVTICCRPAVN